jgi:hypothetical protein
MPPTLQIDFPLEAGEDNLVARIRTKSSYFGLKIFKVESLGNMSEDQIVAAMKKGPCVFVVYENDYMLQETDEAGGVFQTGWRVWRVIVVCTSMRGPLSARRGQDGAYYLSDAVKQFAVGYDPVNDADEETGATYPLLFLSRQNAPSDDLSDYLMMMRFAHPIEATGGIIEL